MSVFINETGVYQAISDDTYYSVKVTVTAVTETEARLYINNATTFLLKKDGTVWYWGESYDGSNAMGNNTQVALPTLNTNLNALPSGIKQLGIYSNDYHACCAITNDGKLYTWGYNGHGGLGRGTNLIIQSRSVVGRYPIVEYVYVCVIVRTILILLYKITGTYGRV